MTTATAERTIRKVIRPTIRRCFRCAAPRASHECREGNRTMAYGCGLCAVKWWAGKL